MWKIANGALWATLQATYKSFGLNNNEPLCVFTEPDWILRYAGGGISHENPVALAEDLISGKKSSDKKMVVIKYEEGGREIGRLEHKANRLLRMRGVYERALQRAIFDRLQIHVNHTREETGYSSYYYPATAYLIENAGRIMIVQNDSMGRLSWINGDVMCSGKLP
jgi:hypothetical protein